MGLIDELRAEQALHCEVGYTYGLLGRAIQELIRLEEKNMSNKIKVMLDEGAFKPEKAHALDAGFDLRTPVAVSVMPRDSAIIHTGIHVEIPIDFGGDVQSKSGLNMKHDLVTTGLVDPDYTGEVVVKLYNLGNTPYFFERGDKIAQLVIKALYPANETEVVDHLNSISRGDNGFGSTGR